MNNTVRLAALTVALESASPRVQLFPAGTFRSQDTRPTDVAHWRLEAPQAQRLIDAAQARQTPYCFDYEHQAIHTRENGQPAPAAGWYSQLEWVEGQGLFAVNVEWTERARTMIAAGEYRFVSPLFQYDRQGNVTCLVNAALTNVPALDGMAALLAAASQQLTGENNVDELLEQLRWMLNLPLSATPDEVTVELKKLIDRLSGGQGTAAARVNLLSLLSEKDNQIAALSQQTTTPPDPAAYAPVSVVNELREQVAALGRQLSGNEVTTLLTAALSDGRVLKGADEDWARRLGEKDVALLREHLATRQPIAALSGLQTGGVPPQGIEARPSPLGALDAPALAACHAFGHSAETIATMMKEEGQP
ncbi:phage protease [Sodalis endosymbiont of Spalangia cameroni]|uniref:phage protease n=1 Tax=Sodalis praecaptivus TaxID=1239307 RepID=UPI0031F7E0A2